MGALKKQRRELNHFFIASTVYYIFIVILSLSLVPILIAVSLIKDQEPDGNAPEFKFKGTLIFVLFLILIAIISLLYLVKRIHWLLVQKDIELRHHSTKSNHEDLSVKLDESQGSLIEEKESRPAPELMEVNPHNKSAESSFHKRNQMY
jgi:cytoskeletal protein RodZ